ncbi:acyl-CoA dehydrogenase family protein [Acidianus sp. RZ1]|uniref:acyl-CoA dehydrogenase family protein n=1 Tax=Acidianus sp. RZ1 TaxID=1540082 RepID=UPI001490D683|nr:acyl-CoA dehydrogenase [Acidianus sp. RZ1]
MMYPFSLSDFKIELTQDHEVVRDAVKEFMEREVSPLVEKGESERDVFKEIKEKARDIGLYGLDVPTTFGGQGGDYISLLIASEEMSRVWTSMATYFLINWMYTNALLKFGSEQLKKEYLPPVAKGEATAAFANTEPSAGTDVAGIKSIAKKEGEKYRVTGRKIFITNGDIADYYLVTARTSPSTDVRWKGITMFLLDKSQVKVEGRIDTIGLKASHTTEISFDAEVPQDRVIGEEGLGFKYAVMSFDYARTIVASQAVGIAQAALEKSLSYSAQRNAFNQPIANFQNVQIKVAETLADVETARLLTYWSGSLYMKGKEKEYIAAASLAKFHATEAAERSVLRAIAIHGGYGVSSSAGVERLLRDIQILKTYEGTNDIQRITAGRQAFRIMGLKV